MLQQPDLGVKIAKQRKKKGLTQGELVEKCNISVRTLQRIESGVVTPRNYTVKCIFEVLELDMNSKHNSSKNMIKTWEMKFKNSINHKKSETMKKLIISSVAIISVLLLLLLIQNNNFFNKQKQAKLVGGWELVGSYHNDKFYPANQMRTLKFDARDHFASYTKVGQLYNKGIFKAINDSIFITYHYNNYGKIEKIPNHYTYKISNDTLTFSGYYLGSVGNNMYRSAYLKEVWVKNDQLFELTATN